MMCYIYDGSFEGLLTAIYETYYRKEHPNKILSITDYEKSFLYKDVFIDTDPNKSDKVYNSIKTKISNQTLKHVFHAFVSENEDSGTWIYNYLRLGWKVGKKLDLHLTDDRVLAIHNITRKVSREIHYMQGLLRFRKIKNDVFYAPFEPQFNIVGLLASHFANRMSDQNWIIHDVKRDIGVLYNQEEWVITNINLKGDITFAEDEEFYQKLWKEYFKNIAIKNRINPKLQKSNMPMKYWKYLIEKN